MLRRHSCQASDYENEIAKGRGCGDGPNYTPWLLVSDVTQSNGMRSRFFSRKCGRVIHVLSRAEMLCFYDLEWNDDVIQIYEQFPLNPKLTVPIAYALGYRHPGYAQGNTVMTTDLLVLRRTSSGCRYEAYQVKSTPDDVSGRTKEKLQIEAEYWKRRSIPWFLLYASDLNKTRADNLVLLAQWRNLVVKDRDLQNLADIFRQVRQRFPNVAIRDLADVDWSHWLQLPLNAMQAVLLLCAQRILNFPIDEIALNQAVAADFTFRMTDV